MIENYQFHGSWIRAKKQTYGDSDVGYYSRHPNTLLKKEFNIEVIQPTKLYVAVLGYYIGYLNGKRIGVAELNSDWTNYRKCIYYDEYDITNLLSVGKNEIIFELGNGMYNPSPLKLLGKYNLRERLALIGEPALIGELVSSDIFLPTDDTWLVGQGNLVFNNLYLGETIDFHLDNPNWQRVETDNINRPLKKSIIPKIKIAKKIYPQIIKKYKKGLYIDFQEITSGFIYLKVKTKNNQKIKIQYSEKGNEEEIDFTFSLIGGVGNRQVEGGLGAPALAIQEDNLICKEGITEFQNQFTYHSFRYVYMINCKEDDIIEMYALSVHTDLKQIGKVTTGHAFFNELYDVGIRTKLNNVHSTFEDCSRERLGYGGDMVALATSNLYTFNLENFYKKIIRDFRYEQTENGGIPETAPYMGIQTMGTARGEGPLLWQLVYPYLVYRHYQYYGEVSLVKEEYPYLQKQLDYLLGYKAEILAHHCLGDHGSLLIDGDFSKPTPDKLFIGYCTILLFLKFNIILANTLHINVDKYKNNFENLKKKIILKFYHEDGYFGEGTQSSFAFAIYLKLIEPQKLILKFVDKIKNDNYIFNSGIFGMSLTYEVLNQYGYDYVIEKWLLQDSRIGFKQMLKNKNKTLNELFVGKRFSLNHAMFSSYIQWYYQGLLGIRIQEDAVGFNNVIIKPYFSKEINFVKGYVGTKQGLITAEWKRDEFGQIIYKIIIPVLVHYQIEKNSYKIVQQDYQQNEVILTYQEGDR